MEGASWLWARSIMRRHWQATLLLAALFGVAGGAVMTATEISRRGATAIDRFLVYTHAPDLLVGACPQSAANERAPCDTEAVSSSVLETLRNMPQVAAVTRGTAAIVGVRDERSPTGWQRWADGAEIVAATDSSRALALGRPIVVAGRLPRPDRIDEIAINPRSANSHRYHIGSTLTVAPYNLEQMQEAGSGAGLPGGTARVVTVVGIVRTPIDLTIGQIPQTDISSIYTDGTWMYTSAAWWRSNTKSVAAYGIQNYVHLRSGVAMDEFQREVAERLPDQKISFEPGIEDVRPARQVVQMQAKATLFVALVALVASLVFVGQATSRQIRLELNAYGVLHTLGLRRRQLLATAQLRAIPISLLAITIAMGSAAAASRLGPIGLASAIEPHPGVRLDGPVLLVGGAIVGLTVALTVLAASLVVNWRASDRTVARRRAHLSVPFATTRVALLLKSMQRGQVPARSATISCAAAVGVVICAAVLVASLTTLGGS